MLRAMDVALQAQHRAGLHDETLHLMPVAARDRLEPSPWSEVALKRRRLGARLLLQQSHGGAHFLTARSWSDDHGVRHGDDDHVLKPDPDQFEPVALRAQQAVRAVDAMRTFRNRPCRRPIAGSPSRPRSSLQDRTMRREAARR